jgi:diadenosine tetraphosphate (Ap4A) HIT family hydrolase
LPKETWLRNTSWAKPIQLRASRHVDAGNLDPRCVSCTAPEDDPLTFAVSDAWKVVLHPDQTVPGALVVVALRHVAKVGDLTAEEAGEFFGLFRQLEQALEEALGATMVNVSCLRNWAYRAERSDPPLFEGHPNPHLRWHVAPRFEEPLTSESPGRRSLERTRPVHLGRCRPTSPIRSTWERRTRVRAGISGRRGVLEGRC